MPLSSGQIPPQGTSRAASDIRQLIMRLAGSDLPVMVFGETGTGKELIAKALHENGKWNAGAFVSMPMETRPAEDVEMAAIWQERLYQARGGTLYIDDIAELPMSLQLSLLATFSDGKDNPPPFRLISSTRRDMHARVRRGVFREDLLVRINVAAIRIPPLRRRIEDIPVLFEFFAERCIAEGEEAKKLDDSASEALRKHSWPGNVRELKNLARTITVLCPHTIICRDDIESALRHSAAPTDIEERGIGAAVERQLRRYFAAHSGTLPLPGLHERIIQEVEKPLIALALEATGGNQLKSAALLGLNRNTLHRKMQDLGIAMEIRRGRKS